MKKFTLTFSMFLIAIAVLAQTPKAFKYQAVARESNGNIIANGEVSFRMSIIQGALPGTVVYSETFGVPTNEFGVVTMDIGKGTVVSGNFAAIDWGITPMYLKTEFDPSGGETYQNMGTSEMLSTPFALYDGDWRISGNNMYSSLPGNVGIGTTTPGNKLEISGAESVAGLRVRYGPTYGSLFGEFKHAGSGGLLINSNAGGGWADMSFQTDGTTRMFIESAGNVGIGTTTPGSRLVVKSAGSSDVFNIISDVDNYLFRLRHTSNNSGALYLYDGSVNNNILLNGGGNSYINGGNLGIGTTTPDAPLHVEDRIMVGEDPSYPTVYGELLHEGGGTGFIINSNAGGGSWADLYFQTNGTTKMFIESAGNVGIGTTTPASRLDVRGNVTIRDNSTGTIAVELGTGLDYAEGFNVTDKTDIEPGTVLCIDPENPGKLKISSIAYDSKVAGIVAGANNLGSGISLGTGSHDFNVALAGRVYCNVDASEQSVEVGDLLTTSSLSGFAMKVVNREKAQGAILGKAMESLAKGQKGQILVLVTLQ
jgi:hypothetical protein